MTSVRKAIFSHETNHNIPVPDSGTLLIYTRIFDPLGHVSVSDMTCSSTEEFIDEDEDVYGCKQKINYFLMDQELPGDVIDDAMMNLIFYVDEVTSSASHGFFRGCVLQVWMDFHSDDYFPEVLQASFDEQTNTIRFKPANKFVVKSLTRKVYNKIDDDKNKKCMVCLEELSNGTRVVTLPCGHDFDDECIVRWFETGHICPLCRFELPCEGSIIN